MGQTTESASEFNWIAFYQRRKKLVHLILFLLVCAGGGAYYYFQQYKPPLETEAYRHLSFNEEYFRVDSFDKALNGDGKELGLMALIDQYSGTKAANLAHYYAGIIFLKKGNFDKALEQLNNFKTSSPLFSLRKDALIADIYAEKNQVKEAFGRYKKVANAAKTDKELAATYLFRAARIIENTDKEAAIQCYQRIQSEYPKTQSASMVSKYLARLINKE